MADSKKINDGGLAFPGSRYEQVGTMRDHGGDTDEPTYGNVDYPGMSRRDWFAGQALAGLLANTIDTPASTMEEKAAHYARISHLYADAMIVAGKAGA